MHQDDVTLEFQVALASAKIRSIEWERVILDKELAGNDPALLTPLAYAMFKFLVDNEIGCDESHWHDFLRDSLEETIMRYGTHGKQLTTGT